MFEAVLQTEWPAVLQDPGLKAATIGVIFSAYRNKEAPYFSTVVWNFPDVNTQKVIEVLIEKHIKKNQTGPLTENYGVHRRSQSLP